ncbi:unnamed protein product [Sphagnum troendelagicum]|uniref:Arabinogalactan-like protein n=1 Tax=Sphagnum troendelagicum TaxID=128251 RepID=A0ABP0V700_9BRYO
MAHFNTPTSRMAAVTNGVMMILLISSIIAAGPAGATPTSPISTTPVRSPSSGPSSSSTNPPAPSPSSPSPGSSSGTPPQAPSPSSQSSTGPAPPPQNHPNAAALTLPSIATAAIVGVIVYMAAAAV